MIDLRLPFWVVNTRTVATHPIQSPCNDPKAIHAFNSGEAMTDYLAQRLAGTWKVTLVADKAALIFGIADAHQSGSKVICVDPKPDGSGGKSLLLRELMAYCNSLEHETA